MPRAPKPRNVTLRAIVDGSEELLRVAGALAPTPRLGAAVLALALGRVCASEGIDFDAVLALVRIGRDGDDLDLVAATALFDSDESPAPRRSRHGVHGT
jgi:hypothetical protein